jgi:hypothetical protein
MSALACQRGLTGGGGEVDFVAGSRDSRTPLVIAAPRQLVLRDEPLMGGHSLFFRLGNPSEIQLPGLACR